MAESSFINLERFSTRTTRIILIGMALAVSSICSTSDAIEASTCAYMRAHQYGYQGLQLS